MYSDLLNTYRIRVRRRSLWEDGCDELSRDFDVKKHLRVKFIGEKGADGGGPRRELFFRMVEEMSKQSMLFEGPDELRTPKHNLMALRQKKYHLIGKIIVLSILNGGPAPKFFPKHILEYLFLGHVTGSEGNIAQITSEDMREKVLKASIGLCMHVQLNTGV